MDVPRARALPGDCALSAIVLRVPAGRRRHLQIMQYAQTDRERQAKQGDAVGSRLGVTTIAVDLGRNVDDDAA